MNYEVLNDYVLTEKVQEKETAIIMNTAKVYKELTVVKVSEGSTLHGNEGRTVYVDHKRGIEINIEDKAFVVVHERDIMVIV